MESFTYHNIFDTKGIEYIAIIAFFLLLIPFWLLLNRKFKNSAIKHGLSGSLKLQNLLIPQGLCFNPNHTWAHLKKSGSAAIGVDDLLLHMIGDAKVTYLRKPGEQIRKGDAIAMIGQGENQLHVESPVSGEILETNEILNQQTGTLNNDPYGDGWLLKLKPLDWKNEIQSCYIAKDAIQWSGMELARIRDFMAASLKKISPEHGGMVLQDGGEIMENSLKEMPKEVWKDFEQHFLRTI